MLKIRFTCTLSVTLAFAMAAASWLPAQEPDVNADPVVTEPEGDSGEPAAEEEASFILFENFAEPINDLLIMSELKSRHSALVAKNPKAWDGFKFLEAAKQCDLAAPISKGAGRPNLEMIAHATGVVVGGSGKGAIWTAGGVFVSADGLFLSNHHVAKNGKWPLSVMTTDGKLHRVSAVLAAEKSRDVALFRVEGDGFPFVPLAAQAPESGQEVIMIHHSEGRFYTYDRGHVRRHSFMDGATYMEISAEYAIGGSGCGIFNSNHELVGLVSTIGYGLGDALPDLADEEVALESEDEYEDDGVPDFVILVRMASSWESIRSLWK